MIVRVADFPAAPDGGWHPELIKSAIRMKGMTLTGLAMKNGLPEGSCRVALIRPHVDADRVIAAFLKVPLSELWPSRYDEDGNDIRHERDGSNSKRDETHRQINTAA